MDVVVVEWRIACRIIGKAYTVHTSCGQPRWTVHGVGSHTIHDVFIVPFCRWISGITLVVRCSSERLWIGLASIHHDVHVKNQSPMNDRNV